MAGTKGRSGGARRNAGRKPLPPEQLNTEKPISVTEVAPKADDIVKDKNIEIYLCPPQDRILSPKEPTTKPMQTSDMRKLVCPIEFTNMPYAKNAWEYVLELDEQSHLLTDRQFENLKSYCLAVELRQNLIAEWERQGKPTTILTRNGELKVNPIVTEISRQSDRINSFASDLGLTIMGEFKVAKEKSTSPKLNGEEKKDDDLFD